MTLAARVSKSALIGRAPSKYVKVVSVVIIELSLSEKEQLKTVTFDNGKECAYHSQKKKYWWLIHQYLPKGMESNKVRGEETTLTRNKLNNRQRKLLEYKTSNEVYDYLF
ncbi:hypothetical protein AB6C93_22875 [Vibrio splendidus]